MIDYKIAKMFEGLVVGLQKIDNDQTFYKKGKVILVLKDSLVLEHSDNTKEAIDLDKIDSIKEVEKND